MRVQLVAIHMFRSRDAYKDDRRPEGSYTREEPMADENDLHILLREHP